jgi:hypothetical protein
MKMIKRKGQAATEFLMTYGWALLVISTTLGAFYYFFINPESIVPPSCVFTDELECIGHKFENDRVLIELKNNAGRSLNLTRIACQTDGINWNQINLNVNMVPGNISVPLDCDLDGLIPDSLTRATVIVYYKFEGQEFPRTTEGNVIGYVTD